MLPCHNDQVKTEDNRTLKLLVKTKDNRTLKLLFQSDSTLKLNNNMRYTDAHLAFFRYESISLYLFKQMNKISLV